MSVISLPSSWLKPLHFAAHAYGKIIRHLFSLLHCHNVSQLLAKMKIPFVVINMYVEKPILFIFHPLWLGIVCLCSVCTSTGHTYKINSFFSTPFSHKFYLMLYRSVIPFAVLPQWTLVFRCLVIRSAYIHSVCR